MYTVPILSWCLLAMSKNWIPDGGDSVRKPVRLEPFETCCQIEGSNISIRIIVLSVENLDSILSLFCIEQKKFTYAVDDDFERMLCIFKEYNIPFLITIWNWNRVDCLQLSDKSIGFQSQSQPQQNRASCCQNDFAYTPLMKRQCVGPLIISRINHAPFISLWGRWPRCWYTMFYTAVAICWMNR